MTWPAWGFVREQPADRLGRAKGGRRQGGAQILNACWPASDMLGVASGVMPDVRDIVNVHGQQREFARDGLPAEARRDRRGVVPLDVVSSLAAGPGWPRLEVVPIAAQVVLSCWPGRCP